MAFPFGNALSHPEGEATRATSAQGAKVGQVVPRVKGPMVGISSEQGADGGGLVESPGFQIDHLFTVLENPKARGDGFSREAAEAKAQGRLLAWGQARPAIMEGRRKGFGLDLEAGLIPEFSKKRAREGPSFLPEAPREAGAQEPQAGKVRALRAVRSHQPHSGPRAGQAP